MASPIDALGELIGNIVGAAIEFLTGKAAERVPMSKKSAWLLVFICTFLLFLIPILSKYFEG